jgi:Tetratricopeptide repeat
VLDALSAMAWIFENEGQLNEAEKLLIHVINTQTVLGENHPDTLAQMTCFALVWRKNGKSKEAIRLLGKWFCLQIQVLGSEHSLVIVSGMMLELCLKKEGATWET